MCKKTIFYGQDSKYVNLKYPNLLSVDDTMAFKGTLYKDEEKTKEIGSSQNTWTIGKGRYTCFFIRYSR